MTDKKIAVVTGGNRGIGLEICRQLAQDSDTQVILTSRTLEKAQSAAQKLAEEGLKVTPFQLETTSAQDIANLAQWLEKEYGGVDILVNNAGVLLDAQRNQASIFQVEIQTLQETLETNLYGPLMLCQALIPLMKKRGYGRIVNLSSGMGQLSEMGGGYTAYRISKTSLNALTRILAAELQGEPILVNAMCPGWVKTDMGGAQANRSVAQGADTAVWLTKLPENGPSGKFFRDRNPISW
ncbi:short-chain dehydrogenase [bacterium (Candidatus Blackallbacteria) CG17_big_fil_post_rev_8_21_14_2_50_48_46]|uniref:Short-chain dehydrogenase n=1 Tax=bacterium (Candidatus Blackallbacteria) CG17_big_fil_post_rev_8_21_14_2_50_48_46 TaxID=2014261 RepID=A0A2M7G420_9BACT|nr:MAG: short-chain dehydrogenase [bacterium (Candidatus Blackallbacteria) CG18_big_fil_WC_8_21_14_2_50_49_26]PIW16610.1 MAG: short-chain dehydrogenase [bacterium (Candidatus Blackallbacteria) CG17_big_fil_post_rev_8_21_14_2_50_48_46]PIW46118.1 MAG: short-chain dehydrogenase [bacterium (Candidatus Blackallbacteria) CG13_big_fil_rev_8_21_14_2_50_49_14]